MDTDESGTIVPKLTIPFPDRLGLRMRSNCCARAALLCALCSFSTAAFGEAWFFQPAVTLGSGYEENADLEEEDTINTTRYDLEAHARGGRLTERSQIVGDFSAFLRRYPGHEDLDSENLSATLNTAFLPSELDRLSLDLSFDRDTSRTSELTTTGNITENVPRYQLRVAPGWERRLTERSTVGVAYAYTQVQFDSNLSGFVDSKQDDIDAFYAYQLTERLAFRGTLGATSYDPDDDQSYKGYDTSLGMSYRYSETLTGGLDIGWQRIDRDTSLDTVSTERTSSGFVYSFSLTKAFERSNLSLSLQKSAVPTGTGEPVDQESLLLGYAYQISPRLAVTLPLGIYRSETISFGGAEENDEPRIFVETEPSLSWRVTEDIVLRASYRYQYQKEEGTSVDGNAIFLSLSYIWPTEIPGLAR